MLDAGRLRRIRYGRSGEKRQRQKGKTEKGQAYFKGKETIKKRKEEMIVKG